MLIYKPYVIILVLVALLFGLGILISQLGKQICISKNCAEKGRILRRKVNSKLNPCKNFYKYVCERPSNDSKGQGEINIVWQRIENNKLWQVVEMLDQPLRDTDDSILLLGKTLFKQCSNLNLTEKQGLTPLMRAMGQTSGIPFLNLERWDLYQSKSWTYLDSEFNNLIAGFTPNFFEFRVKTSLQNTNNSKKIIHYPFFSMPAKLKKMAEIGLGKYLEYSLELYSLLSNNKTLDENVKKVLAEAAKFNDDMLNLLRSYTAKDCSKEQYEIKESDVLIEFEDNFYDVVQMLESIGGPNAVYEQIVMPHGFENYIKNLTVLIKKTPVHVIGSYIAINNILEVTQFLPRIFRSTYKKYFKEYKTHSIDTNTKVFCAEAINNKMSSGLTYVYLKTHSLPKKEDKEHLDNLVIGFKKKIKLSLNKVRWIDRKTKQNIIKKINNLKVVSPLPKEVIHEMITNKTAHSNYFEFLCMSPFGFLESYLTLSSGKFSSNARILRGNYSIFNEEYNIFSSNIYFDDYTNNLIVPMGYLRFPIFDNTWPRYLNYGGVGSKLATEIVQFITRGTGEGSASVPVDWWSQSKGYKEKGYCFIKNYNEDIEPSVKRKLSDVNCVEEIIAVVTGVKISLLAYHEYSRTRLFDEPKLPGFEDSTNDQLFFFEFTSHYCNNNDKVYSQGMTDFELKSPSNEYIVLESLRNRPQFSKAFGCKKGDFMNPSTKCYLW